MVVVIVISFLIAAGAVFYAFNAFKNEAKGGADITKLREEVRKREELKAKLDQLYGQVVGLGRLRDRGKLLISLKEAVKTERGRITITQAELETVEARLRELEEIERELAASNIDAQEEIKVLEKKRAELGQKNETLKNQLNESSTKIEELTTQVQFTAAMQEQIQSIRGEIVQTQEKIDLILMKVEESTGQYFLLKKRYDALDIEYAQLYEKFAAAESAQPK